MKTNITISIDQKIVEFLKAETNYSDLVNQQLKAYYDVKGVENIEILKRELTKTKQILKENRRKRREIEAQLGKIASKEKKFKSLKLSRAKLIMEITKRRHQEATNKNRRVQYFESAEREADRLLKGGK